MTGRLGSVGRRGTGDGTSAAVSKDSIEPWLSLLFIVEGGDGEALRGSITAVVVEFVPSLLYDMGLVIVPLLPAYTPFP
jgi:hypothetical protein